VSRSALHEQASATQRDGRHPPAARRQATGSAPTPGRAPVLRLAVQRLPEVSEPNDPLEVEAAQTAQRIVSGQPAGPISSLAGGTQRVAVGEDEVRRVAVGEDEIQPVPVGEAEVQRVAVGEEEVQPVPVGKEENGEEPVQRLVRRLAQGQPAMTSGVASTLRFPSGGAPMPPSVRSAIEPGLGVDLGGVRVHDGAPAHEATARLQARAATYGSHLFLGRGESAHDLPLMAHEATHVVQQGAFGPAPGQGAGAAAAGDGQIQRLPAFITDELADYARYVPGYTLLTVIVGVDPLTGEAVERNAVNLVGGLMGLSPLGTVAFDKLVELGLIDQAFAFVDRQLAAFDLSIARIEQVISEAWDEMDFLRLDPFEYNLSVLVGKFTALVEDVAGFAGSLLSAFVDLIREAAIGLAEPLLDENPAWSLIKKVLHYDPLRGVPVEATTVEILEDFLRLIGRETEIEQMRAHGTLQETADWIDTQLAAFQSLVSDLGALFAAAWEAIQPENLPNLTANLQTLALQAFALLQRAFDFATTVAAKVLELVKTALLGWLSEFALAVPGFHLLTVVLGRNPFTGEEVPRSAENLIRGFITLLPGGNATYDQLAESGVIGQAAANIEGAMAELGISWEMVTGLFRGIWDGLSIDDLVDPIGAFTRIRDQFGEPLLRLFAFVRVVLSEIFQLILALMNFPTEMVVRIVTNAMQAYEAISQDPIGFLLNMMEAVKQGFTRFFGGIWGHLLSGLMGWLFRGLRGAGIEPPTELTLQSALDLLMQILGITEERLWEKLAERIGQDRVDQIRDAIAKLTGIWTFVRDVQEQGVSAIWKYVQSQLSNLWGVIIQFVATWLMERIITQGIVKLLSFLDPTFIMSVVNGFIALFYGIQSTIEYIRDLLEIIDRFVGTIASVARGDVDPGAAMLEQGLIAAVPVAIGFLAAQVGLGNVSDKIAEIVGGIREVVDSALDWLMDQAEAALQSILGVLGFGDAEPTAGPAAAVPAATQPVPADLDPTDHESVATHAVQDLEQGTVEGDYETVRAQKEAQAREIEQRYTPMLAPGIALTITFSPPQPDVADEDLDFAVVIAPNTIRKVGNVLVEEKFADQPTGPGAAAKPGRPVALLIENIGDFVDSVDQVMVTEGGVRTRGITTRTMPGTHLFPYEQYGKTWDLRPVPAASGFARHGPVTGRGGRGGSVTVDIAHLYSGGSADIPPQFHASSAYGPAYGPWIHAGHLVAKSFGGPGDWLSSNVVAMTMATNLEKEGMQGPEYAVRTDIENNRAVYRYSVWAHYDNSQLPPYGVELQVERVYPTSELPKGLKSITLQLAGTTTYVIAVTNTP
jgi:hypothetical protein